MTDYLTIYEVLAIHRDQIENYGGLHGIRDRGMLEAALSRPKIGYYTNILEEAAALWESLSQNHPFIDGNKRTAFAVTYTFLAINRVNIKADSDTIYQFINQLYETNSFEFGQLVKWLEIHTVNKH